MFPQNLAAQCQAAFIKSPVVILHFPFLWMSKSHWSMAASCCCISYHRKHQIQALGSKLLSGWTAPSPGIARLAQKATALPPSKGIFQRTIHLRVSDIMACCFQPEVSFTNNKKSGERIGLWQTCPQKKIWGQVFRCHKSAAVKEQHWFTSAECQPVNPHWHTVEKQAFPSTWAISFTKPPFLSAPPLHSNVYRRAALCFEVLVLLLFMMPDSFSGLFFPPSPPAMKSSAKWSAILLPSIPGFCGSSLRGGSCRLWPWSLDTVQYCEHSCAEIYVPHSKKPLKSSSLLASSQALCAWEIKCLRANSQFITDLTEQKPLLVWEHPQPNGCVRASLFTAFLIYFKFFISLG